MLCVVIKGPSEQEVLSQIEMAKKTADLIELRLDLFESTELNKIKQICSHCSLPVILTLRSSTHGGKSSASEQDRHALLLKLAELNPAYIDLEYPCDLPLIPKLPSHKLILSYHNTQATPPLQPLYEEMQKSPAWIYKIAVQAQTTLDALHLLNWAREQKKDNCIAISMGPFGQLSRILSSVIHNPITYAALQENDSSTGQLGAEKLIEQYRFHTLTSKTSLYGLIGDPITLSISDHTHNAFFQTHKLSAVYIKMAISPQQIGAFLEQAKRCGFQGLSVTMPLKRTILAHLKQIDEEAKRIGAVNTLVLKDKEWIGYNTDGKGALNAIEKRRAVKGKHLLFLGSGGAAQAIAYEAHKRGAAKLTFLNRDEEKAKGLAKLYGGKSGALEGFAERAQEGYDILINCLPVDLDIKQETLLTEALIMDIRSKPKDTPLLLAAHNKGCSILYGYEMFLEQALLQFALWDLPLSNKDSLEKAAAQIL